jgi:hypothetical protein
VPNFRHELNVIFDGEFDTDVEGAGDATDVVGAGGLEGAGATVDETVAAASAEAVEAAVDTGADGGAVDETIAAASDAG